MGSVWDQCGVNVVSVWDHQCGISDLIISVVSVCVISAGLLAWGQCVTIMLLMWDQCGISVGSVLDQGWISVRLRSVWYKCWIIGAVCVVSVWYQSVWDRW